MSMWEEPDLLPAGFALCVLCAGFALWTGRGFSPGLRRELLMGCALLLAAQLLTAALTVLAGPDWLTATASLLVMAAPLLTLWLLARAFRCQSQLELAQWQRDGLTGLLTRRAMSEKALQMKVESLGLILLDIDHFKRINDHHLHAGGDRVLVHAARELGAQLRLTDCVSRHGGEEFCVLLPGASPSRTAELAERLVAQARDQRVRMPDGSEQGYTLSAGIAHCTSAHRLDAPAWEALLQRADAALYAAKRSGRDRVGLCAPQAHQPVAAPHHSLSDFA